MESLHAVEELDKYKGAMADADKAYVYFNPETVKHKKLEEVSEDEVYRAFDSDNVTVYTDSVKLREDLRSEEWVNRNLLMMSSGNFDGISYDELGEEFV